VAVRSAELGPAVRIFTTPGASVYLTATCRFLDRSSAAPTSPLRLCLQPRSSPQNPNSGPSGSRYLPSIATPVPEGPLTSDQVNHIIERLQGIIQVRTAEARQLRRIPPAVGRAHHHLTPTGHVIPTALEVDTCTTEEGRTDIAGCIRPHRPLGASSATAKDMATMVVDTAAEGAVMMTCPSVVILVVLPMEDLACYDGMDCLVGTVRGLGMGMSNGGAAPGSALGVGEFDFGDASPQFPAASDTLRGDSLYGLPRRWPWQRYDRKWCRWMVPVRLRETPRVLVGSLGCSPSALVEVRAMRAVLTARLRLLQQLVVLERVRRGIRQQLGDETELV